MPDYTALAATAKRLIEAAGKPLELRRRATAPADASKPWRGPGGPETAVPVRGVVLGFKLTPDTSDFVKRGDKYALVAATSTVEDLTTMGLLVDGTVIWNIETVEPLEPGEVRLLYKIHLRK